MKNLDLEGKEQQQYIIEQLNNYSLCNFNINSINEISISLVQKILDENFINGSDMKAILCMFDTIFKTKGEKTQKGLYNFSENVNKWLKTMKKLIVKSTEGYIYTADIISENIKIILKIPQNIENINHILREYYIGVEAINNLRYTVPNFLYTLGGFFNKDESDKENAFILYEYIPGYTINDLITTNKINFSQWLNIFFQLLIALEMAQRKIQFTHYDLHTSNIIVRNTKGKDISFVVPIDNVQYSIINPEYIPVIIDYGFTSVFTKNKTIGKNDYKYYTNNGIYNVYLPGHDIYKFIAFSLDDAHKKKDKTLYKNIKDIFSIYGKDDPYNLYKAKTYKNLKEGRNVFFKDMVNSDVITYDPNTFLKWLWKNYSHILNDTYNCDYRSIYESLKFTSTIKEYNDIFKNTKSGQEKISKIIKKCAKYNIESYVVSQYMIDLLENYNENLKYQNIYNIIDNLKNNIKHNKNLLLSNDIEELEKVFDIFVPPKTTLVKICKNILSIYKYNEQIMEVFKDYVIEKFLDKIEPYLLFYYTILQLNLENNFIDWIKRFTHSDIYKFYNENILLIKRTEKWYHSILSK